MAHEGWSGKLLGFNTGELHPFTKSSETDQGLTTVSTALLSGIRQVLIRE